MVDVKDYLVTALVVFSTFCTVYVPIIIPMISLSPELTENQLRLLICSPLMFLIVYWLIALLVLGVIVIEENITIWNEMKKDWEKKKTPTTRMREDEPTTYGFERNMTQLNHQTTQESENK